MHRRPGHTAEELEKASFQKIFELLARLERLETSKRDPPDHRHHVRRRFRERNSRKYRHHGRVDPGSDSSTDQIPHRRCDASSSHKWFRENDDRHRKWGRTPPLPKDRSLMPLVATDSRFRRFLNYRYCRLDRSSNLEI